MPETPVYAIGVPRGQFDVFSRLLEQIDRDTSTPRLARAKIVILGDLLFGKGSRDMLAAVSSAERASDGQVKVILGRQDRLILDFIENPPFEGSRFLANGGRDLLTSLGIGMKPDITAQVLHEVAETLRDRLGQKAVAWLASRPLSWTSGNVVFVHAGLDPHKPLSRQRPDVVLKGHPRFRVSPFCEGHWVVHAEPGSMGGISRGRRIAVGGGLVEQGRIDAVRIAPNEFPQYLSSDGQAYRLTG
jgi:serine/threonine protein phosphatase 1